MWIADLAAVFSRGHHAGEKIFYLGLVCSHGLAIREVGNKLHVVVCVSDWDASDYSADIAVGFLQLGHPIGWYSWSARCRIGNVTRHFSRWTLASHFAAPLVGLLLFKRRELPAGHASAVCLDLVVPPAGEFTELVGCQRSCRELVFDTQCAACKFVCARHPSEWVDEYDRVVCVRVEVNSTPQPYGVLVLERSAFRSVIPMPVVMQPGLRVRVLALEAQVAFQRCGLLLDDLRDRVALAGEDTPGWVCGDRFAPGGVVGGPDEVAVGVGDLARGAEVVDVDVEDLGLGWGGGFGFRRLAELAGELSALGFELGPLFGVAVFEAEQFGWEQWGAVDVGRDTSGA